jgi:adenylate kinase
MDTRTIFFVGKPGCGKGTQTKLLSEKTGWKIIKAGEQFRSIAAEDTPLGHKVKSEIDAGILAPHWFASYLYLEAFFALSEDTSVIVDGFNRKILEAEVVIDSLRWLDRPFQVLHIKVSDEAVRERLALRKGIEGRADDSAVDERLKEYHEYTQPVLELFRKAGVLVEIDGNPSPEEIAVEVNKALNL